MIHTRLKRNVQHLVRLSSAYVRTRFKSTCLRINRVNVSLTAVFVLLFEHGFGRADIATSIVGLTVRYSKRIPTKVPGKYFQSKLESTSHDVRGALSSEIVFDLDICTSRAVVSFRRQDFAVKRHCRVVYTAN